MEANEVLQIYKDLSNQGVLIWLDGGWGIDALLQKQTREHADVDIIVEEKNLSRLKNYFSKQEYQPVFRDDTCDWNFVLGHSFGQEVDVHVINLDSQKNGLYGPAENAAMYPASALTAVGEIEGIRVRCLTPEYQLESHTGYELKEKDYQDCLALCEKFNLKLPPEYENFKT